MRAVRIQEQTLGPEHPYIAHSLNRLGALYRHQRRHEEAGPRLRSALAIWRRALGSGHPYVATGLHSLALLELELGLSEEAATNLKTALEIRNRTLGADHPHTVCTKRAYDRLQCRPGAPPASEEAGETAATRPPSSELYPLRDVDPW